MQGAVEQLGRDAKVLFVSEDGVKFRLFVDGHEIKVTRGNGRRDSPPYRAEKADRWGPEAGPRKKTQAKSM